MNEPTAPLFPVSPRKNLRASLGDAAFYSVMVGLGESLFPAFALALGSGATAAGLVATVPMLSGAALQLAAPRGLSWLGSHQKWVVWTSGIQAVSLLLLPLAALATGSLATLWVFIAATLYWGGVMSAGPAWNTWIEGIIPRRVRTHFLACRARVSQFCTMLGFLAGGVALQAAASQGTSTGSRATAIVLATFCGIFVAAAVCRFASVFFLARHREQKPIAPTRQRVSPLALFGSGGHHLGGKLVLLLLTMQVAVQISGPYFTPFLLEEQKISYFSYMLLMAITFLGKVVALPVWGRVARAAGARRLMWLGGMAIVPISGLWILSPLFAQLQITVPAFLGLPAWTLSAQIVFVSCIQLISGIAWAGYELAIVLMFLEAIPRRERTSVLTLYNFGNAAAMVIGSLIGGLFLKAMGETYFTYLLLFGLSSVARGTTLLCLARASLAEQARAGIDEPAVALRVIAPDDAPVSPRAKPDPAQVPAAAVPSQQAAG